MKKTFLSLALLALLALGAQAQRFACVDVQLILDNMSEYQQAQEQLDQLAAQWKQEIDQEYDKIKSMYNKYQSEQVLLSEDAKTQREDEIMAKEKAVRELQRQKFGPEGELFQRRRELVQPLQDRVYEAIEQYANDRGYDFIFDKGGNAGMLFASERHDKTADLMSKLGIN